MSGQTAPVFDWGDVLRILVYGAVWAGAFALFNRFSARRSRRQMAVGRTVVAARSLTGRAHPVLSPIWSGFRVAPHPGRLDVRHTLINDVATSVAVAAVEPGERRPRMREKWRLNVVNPRVLTLRTPEGPIELAVAADQVAWLRDRLAGADRQR